MRTRAVAYAAIAAGAVLSWSTLAAPATGQIVHGRLDKIAWGAYGEIRIAEDRVRGVTDPEWFSFGRVGGFLTARATRRLDLAAQGAYDRGSEDFTLERLEATYRLKPAFQVHAGIFLVPLGRTNLSHESPLYEFDEHSLVATQLVGVPHAQLGAGAQGGLGSANGWPLTFEFDVVTGYGEGIVMEGAGGTRMASGRLNYGDDNGVPALAGRVAAHPSASTEIGLAAETGRYNRTVIDGMPVDDARYAHVVVADAASRLAGFDVAAEAAVVMVDVPPGIGTLYAERQWGAAFEASRPLLNPLVQSWKGSSLTGALRADAVDLDRAILGDSRMRISASLNVRPQTSTVARFGWYYELRRDRFNNETPAAGLTLSLASYF
jgi:hypothetical protein